MIGIMPGKKEFDFQQTMVCGKCGRFGGYRVFMTWTQLLLFFIPVFRWNRRYYVRTTCCDSVYELQAEKGKMIARGEAVTIHPEDLTPMEFQNEWGGYQ